MGCTWRKGPYPKFDGPLTLWGTHLLRHLVCLGTSVLRLHGSGTAGAHRVLWEKLSPRLENILKHSHKPLNPEDQNKRQPPANAISVSNIVKARNSSMLGWMIFKCPLWPIVIFMSAETRWRYLLGQPTLSPRPAACSQHHTMAVHSFFFRARCYNPDNQNSPIVFLFAMLLLREIITFSPTHRKKQLKHLGTPR